MNTGCPHCKSPNASFGFKATGISQQWYFIPVANGFSREIGEEGRGNPLPKTAKCDQCGKRVSMDWLEARTVVEP